jgi:hypothetical protein
MVRREGKGREEKNPKPQDPYPEAPMEERLLRLVKGFRTMEDADKIRAIFDEQGLGTRERLAKLLLEGWVYGATTAQPVSDGIRPAKDPETVLVDADALVKNGTLVTAVFGTVTMYFHRENAGKVEIVRKAFHREQDEPSSFHESYAGLFPETATGVQA